MGAELPVVFIMGATASGKTDLAMELVTALPADIVSVDSAMIYRDMDIGTAKPTCEELERAPHALIDILDPAQSWSVGAFCEAARAEIDRSHARGRIPLLTGGTMMYFRALEHGLNDLPTADPEVRAKIDREAVECGWPEMHRTLAQHDPAAAARIHPNDSQRIQRALEVFYTTGTPLSELQSRPSQAFDQPLLKYVLHCEDRAELHERIHRRFDRMMEVGLLDEVRALFDRGDLDAEMSSIRSVGYRQLWAHLTGDLALAEAVANAKTATRQLAKRQITWIRSTEHATALPSGDRSVVRKVMQDIENAV